MPLRDHFHPPLSNRRKWEGFHGGWPMMIVNALDRKLPPDYIAEPGVHLGPLIEVDVGTLEDDIPDPPAVGRVEDGGVATATWAPPSPTLTQVTASPDQYEYEVRIYDAESGRHLVAAVELVSPANKDRPDNRRAFVTKCATLLQSGVCVTIVDVVTDRTANLYADLMDHIGQDDPALAGGPPSLYAVSCRWMTRGRAGLLQIWSHPLELGKSLPTLPLWIAEDRAVPLELEASYEETCRVLRIP